MQFLPSTWDRWAADGDGDGRADPQDLDDAAVYSYNHSAGYVRAVYEAAQAYATGAS